jgi:hypothetical protein
VAQAKGKDLNPHFERVKCTELYPTIAVHLIPIYTRVSDPNLLQRSSHGKTQTANESFNALIWVNPNKTIFVGKLRVETSVSGSFGSQMIINAQLFKSVVSTQILINSRANKF